MSDKDEWKPKRRLRRHVYYKVQIYDNRSKAWRDQKPAFDSLDDARAYLASEITAPATVRIMSVDGRERKPVDA